MRDILDISVPLYPDMPVWPGSAGFRLERTQRLEAGDEANVSRVDCDVHMGTHVDAPLHFVEGATPVDQLRLETLIGPATVAFLPDAEVITADELRNLHMPAGVERLLLRTRNSELWTAGVNEFRKDYVALTAEAARWLVASGIRLVGVDYLSVQRYQDDPTVHQMLLAAEIVVVEGLNLSAVKPGQYELACLPLKLVGAEAAPARAILRPLTRMERSY
jgi:arylformamidase